jgi:HSP20 family protein
MAIAMWRPLRGADRWDSLDSVSDIHGEMNRLFDSFFGRSMPAAAGGRSWAPSLDAQETKDEFVFTVEVPGVREKDVTVSIMGDLLSVRGERRSEQESKEQESKENDAKEQGWRHVERVYGKFERTIQLPTPVQTDKVKATYRDGLLEIRVPKAEEVKPREIKIEVA